MQYEEQLMKLQKGYFRNLKMACVCALQKLRENATRAVAAQGPRSDRPKEAVGERFIPSITSAFRILDFKLYTQT